VLVESVDDSDGSREVVGRAAHQGPDVDGVTLLVDSGARVGDLVRAEVVGTEGADLIAKGLQ
jgi:hypothetical protein